VLVEKASAVGVVVVDCVGFIAWDMGEAETLATSSPMRAALNDWEFMAAIEND
jgi:hypothetical protein